MNSKKLEHRKIHPIYLILIYLSEFILQRSNKAYKNSIGFDSNVSTELKTYFECRWCNAMYINVSCFNF